MPVKPAPFALCALLALGLTAPSSPVEAAPTARAAKTSAVKKSAPRARARKRSAKRSPLRSVKMTKAKGVLKKFALPADAPRRGGSNDEPPADPFADMPTTPVAEAVGVTENAFTVSPMQTRTPHNNFFFHGNVIDFYWWGFRLKGADDVLAVYPKSQWMADHDLTIECWGEFSSGDIKVVANGQNSDHENVEFGTVTVAPPVGNRGRIKVAIPTKGMSPLWYFNLAVKDANGKGPSITLYQCRVERD